MIANALLRIALAASLPLLNEEAYYWEWSYFPAAGYLDHPPLVAWLIRGVMALAPSGAEWVVRTPALLMGLGSQWLVFQLALTIFGSGRVAWRALLVFLGLPLPTMVGLLMVTEAPLVFFALLSLVWLAQAARGGTVWKWVLGGSALGLALLSNFLAALLVPAIVAFAGRAPVRGRWAGWRGASVALLSAAVVAAPFIIWNAQHEWSTFTLQLGYRHAQEIEFGVRRFAECFFEQWVNTGPFLFLPLLWLLCVRRRGERAAPAAGAPTLRKAARIVFFSLMAVGAVVQTHPHWTLLAYPPAAVLLAAEWLGDEPTMPRRRRQWAHLSVFTVHGLLLVGVLLLLTRTVGRGAGVGSEGSKAALAAGRMLGWPEVAGRLARRLAQERADPEGPPLVFAGDYRYSAPLSYQRKSLPLDERIVIHLGPYVRTRPQPGDAQIYYRPLADLAGRSGLLIVRARDPHVARFCALFEHAEELEPLRQTSGSHVVCEYRVFRVRGLRPRPPYAPEGLDLETAPAAG